MVIKRIGDRVCMSCRMFISQESELPNECCLLLSFAVDAATVVVDPATGLISQASPKLEENADARR